MPRDRLSNFEELADDAQAFSASFETAEHFTTSLLEGFLSARVTQIITDQEQLRKALSAALASQGQELLIKNLAVNTSINGIMLTDLDGKVTWVNPSYLQMWGCKTADQVLGLPFADFWLDGEAGRILKNLPQTGAGTGSFRPGAGTAGCSAWRSPCP